MAKGVSAGVQVVADLPAERYAIPSLPDHCMAWSADSRHLLYIAAPSPRTSPAP